MQFEPLISVLMTAYNREKYIAQAIESVLASTYKNFELIIVDDCSSDNTAVISKAYESKDRRVKVYQNEINLKDYPNRNKAAQYAKGKYIKYLDSDDIIYSWGLEAMVCCMEQFPNAGYGLISYGLKSTERYPILLTPAKAYYEFYFRGSMIITGPTGAIFKRDIFEMEKGFSGKPYIGDTEMWLKMSMRYDMVAMPLELVWWRQHEEQQYKEGYSNNYYQQNSYAIYISALLHPYCPFTELYKKQASRNLKNRYVRNLLKDLLKGNVHKSAELYKLYKFTFLDVIKSFRFNIYPPPL